MEDKTDGVENLNVEVSEENGNIVFLHKIVKGKASRSYGIHVAKLAGVPNVLLENAEKKLDILETEGKRISVTDSFLSEHASSHNSEHQKEEQLSFFRSEINPAVEELKKLDLMEVKPSEANIISARGACSSEPCWKGWPRTISGNIRRIKV